MRCLVPQLRQACWKLVLFRFLLYSIAASGQLALSPPNLNFGSVQVGSNRTLSVAVSNSGKSNLTVSQATVSGTGFSFAGPSLPITLGPQQTATLSASFAPQASGSVSGSISVATLNPIGNSGKQRSSNRRLLSREQVSARPQLLHPDI
jgi:Abnormal spindle-like microcephaly-assoc'd, ASPM-SPD-2-Hydin